MYAVRTEEAVQPSKMFARPRKNARFAARVSLALCLVCQEEMNSVRKRQSGLAKIGSGPLQSHCRQRKEMFLSHWPHPAYRSVV